MKVKHLFESELRHLEPNRQRLDQIAATIIQELKSGERDHWDMSFKNYVHERMGDMDWDGAGAARDGDMEFDEDYQTAYDYIVSKIPSTLKEAKRDASEIMNREIGDLEKIELLVTGMAPGDYKFQRKFVDMFYEYASPEQRAVLPKLYNFGWKISKILWTKKTPHKIAFAVDADGTAAWIAPNGKVERAPVGKKTAYLADKDWIDA